SRPSDVLVIYHDLEVPTGKIRMRQIGRHGGHKGIRSIIDQLATQELKRLRIGVGRPSTPMTVVDYVLQPFDKEQKPIIAESIQKSAAACEAWMTRPFPEVMNEFNV